MPAWPATVCAGKPSMERKDFLHAQARGTRRAGAQETARCGRGPGGTRKRRRDALGEIRMHGTSSRVLKKPKAAFFKLP
jgi:hypothetical protein